MKTQETHTKHISLEFGEVLTRTYKHFKKAFLPMLAFFGITVLSIISFTLFVAAITLGVLYLYDSIFIQTSIIAAALFAIFFALWAIMATTITNIKILINPTFDFLPIFKESFKDVPKIFSILVVISLAEIGGVILGVLPGIWISVVLYFSTFIAVIDKSNLAHTISKSAHLVKNNFWNVFSFVLFSFVGNFLLSLIPWIGSILSGLFSLYILAVTYELYKTMLHNKEIPEGHVYTHKNIVLVTKLFAVCAVIAFVGLGILVGSLIKL